MVKKGCSPEDITAKQKKDRRPYDLPGSVVYGINDCQEDEVYIYIDAAWNLSSSCIAGVSYNQGRIVLSWH